MANEENAKNNENMKLDDAQRVKVLSPGMLVAKRFFRNKLAIIGMVIIICMFLFSFLGGAIIPYSQSQVFYRTEEMKKDYAGATYIDDYQMYQAEDVTLPSDIFSKTILAIGKKQNIVETRDGSKIGIRKLEDNAYVIYSAEDTKNPKAMRSDEHNQAVAAGDNYFEYDGVSYIVDDSTGKELLYIVNEMAVACKMSFTPYSADTKLSYDFYKNALIAMSDGAKKFDAAGTTYELELEGEDSAMVKTTDGADYAYISDMNINSVVGGVFLTPDFKEAAILAIEEGTESFEYTDGAGETDTYLISEKTGQYIIQRNQETRVIDTYAKPSKDHWIGTDANGMDLLARLMYVIYCIPAMPLYLILGSIMDHYRASATVRIYSLCVVMSIIGWVGIARIVRGQILSLREQEFMVATEATGIRVSRRIFKHLIPNVVPQLIVFATMGLGDVILAEATLSFLGLGIKYPAASWGSIINAVNDSYVMTNYLFVWIPAGLLILLTVLAFNFIGDGLRDAFDPKMKR